MIGKQRRESSINQGSLCLHMAIMLCDLQLVETTMSNSPSNDTFIPHLIPVPHWSRHHDWPPIGGLRSLIFNRHQNGFDKVVKKVGRRILIDEAAFFQWVAEQKEGSKKNVKS